MTHLSVHADGVVTVDGNMVTIDLSDMPLKKLTAMARLNEGMGTWSEDWATSVLAADKALKRHLDKKFEPVIIPHATPNSFTITVTAEAGDAQELVKPIIDFFARENIRLVDETQPQPRIIGTTRLAFQPA